MSEYKIHMLVCGGTGCKASEATQVLDNLQTEINNQGLEDFAQVVQTGCFGFCEKGPIVKVIPDNTFYTQVTPTDAKEIVEEHVVKGRKVERLLYTDPKSKETISDSKGMGFYKKQMRIALRNCGIIDPENIEEYIARGGYEALGNILANMTPEEAIEVVKASGLRGRGGGGFPTGFKMGTYPSGRKR
jgi:NADP-reducing hydrogenase subunit HndC